MNKLINQIQTDQKSLHTPPANLDIDSFVNMLWDRDMDMGVDRLFYDPVLKENELKKQQAEQNRLLELKKKQAQQMSMYYTIDEETGERIPKPSTGPYQPPAQFTEDSELNKELAEIGELAGWDYLSEMDGSAQEQQQENTVQEQPKQQPIDFFNDIIIQTDDKPNPLSDPDLWPTEITMFSGSSQESLSDLVMPSASDELDVEFMSQLWQSEPNTPSAAGVFKGYTDELKVNTQQYSAYSNEVDTQRDMYNSSVSPANTYYAGEPYMDTFSNENGGDGSSMSYNEDVKPYYLFNQGEGGSQNNNGNNSSSSSGYSGSENGDNTGMTKAEQERERRSKCRDEMKCKELGVPFTVDMITNHPVEEFNALLRKYMLSEEQLTVIKDIRRRGKNKVAAQNCRKKKLNELTGLELEIQNLKRKRTDLVRDKDELKKSKLHLRKQLDETYAEVFNSIRDHLGRPYDPRFYTLHISDDGDARIIPNKLSTYAMLNYQHTA